LVEEEEEAVAVSRGEVEVLQGVVELQEDEEVHQEEEGALHQGGEEAIVEAAEGFQEVGRLEAVLVVGLEVVEGTEWDR
jgi:hypothetical protein